MPKPFYPYAPDVVTAVDEFTRPANTTAYTIGDQVGETAASYLEFGNASLNAAGSGKIKGAKIVKSTATVTLATFTLWLFDAAPTGVADNAAFAFPYADRAKLIGRIAFAIMVTSVGAGAAFQTATADLPFKLPAGKTVYGIIEAAAAYTPASAETFSVELQIERF